MGMICREQQKKETVEMKERTFILKLSDADVKRFAEKAAIAELTMEDLLSSFIGDLVCGTHSKGSDERMLAENWFERCGYGRDKYTLLHYLIEYDEVDEFLERKKWEEDCREQVRLWEKDITEADEKWTIIVDSDKKPCYKSVDDYLAERTEYLETAKQELQAVEDEINDYWNGFLKWTECKEPDKEKEFNAVLEWQKRMME